jgi:hypothetical protein
LYVSMCLQAEEGFPPCVGHLGDGNRTPRHIYEGVSKE